MDNKWFKNYWFLTVILLLITFIASAIGSATGMDIISTIGPLIGAIVIGQIYANKIRKPIPKETKIKVVTVFTVIQFVLGIWYFWAVDMLSLMGIGILLVFSLIIAAIIYLMMGWASKSYLKSLEKKK